jgi:hypothetical protein
MEIEAWCQNAACNHHSSLDLEKLRDRFGPDGPAMEWDLKPKLKCARCGGKKIGLIYSPDLAKAKPQWGVSAYQKAKGL